MMNMIPFVEAHFGEMRFSVLKKIPVDADDNGKDSDTKRADQCRRHFSQGSHAAKAAIYRGFMHAA
jgi:hypothetical protein